METRAPSLKMHETSCAENRDGGSARESVSVSETVKQGSGEAHADDRKVGSGGEGRSRIQRQDWSLCVYVGQVGGLHLLNEPCQHQGVPWATGGFSPAQHRGRLHHHWGVQGV